MSKLMEKIWAKAQADKKRIVLPEGEEERNLQACGKITEKGLANIILVGSEKVIREKAASLGVSLEGVEVIDPETSDKTAVYANEFYELRKKKGMTLEKADQVVEILYTLQQ